MSTPTETREKALAERLAGQTGISFAQACELIMMLGAEWSSLIREARTMAQSSMIAR